MYATNSNEDRIQLQQGNLQMTVSDGTGGSYGAMSIDDTGIYFQVGNDTGNPKIVGTTADNTLFLEAGILKLGNIPTSSSGLPSGAVWRSGSQLMIVP
jgi:hypothetical protein